MLLRTAPTFRNLLAIFCGCVMAIASCFILLTFSFLLGLFGWSDGGDQAFLRRLETSTEISLYVSIFVSAATGGYLSSYMAKFKRIYFITAPTLVLLALVFSNFDFTDALVYPTILVGCILGGVLNKKEDW
jgi:hypothetical protein